MNNNRLGDLSVELWDRFDKVMAEKGCMVSSTNDSQSGWTSKAYTDDQFVPIIKFINWFRNVELLHGGFVSIFVEDRKGNSILMGDTVVIYSVDIDENDTDEDIKKRFEKMLDDVINKYGSYCRENRLDFVYNKMATERVNY